MSDDAPEPDRPRPGEHPAHARLRRIHERDRGTRVPGAGARPRPPPEPEEEGPNWWHLLYLLMLLSALFRTMSSCGVF